MVGTAAAKLGLDSASTAVALIRWTISRYRESKALPDALENALERVSPSARKDCRKRIATSFSQHLSTNAIELTPKGEGAHAGHADVEANLEGPASAHDGAAEKTAVRQLKTLERRWKHQHEVPPWHVLIAEELLRVAKQEMRDAVQGHCWRTFLESLERNPEQLRCWATDVSKILEWNLRKKKGAEDLVAALDRLRFDLLAEYGTSLEATRVFWIRWIAILLTVAAITTGTLVGLDLTDLVEWSD